MTKLLDLKNNSVITINQNNYTKEDNYKKVCYLDTDNITNNRINAFLKIDLTKEKLPSRAKRKCSLNSIIYSSVRPNQRHFGIIKEIPKNFLVSTAFIVIDIIDLKKLDPNYLYYYITQDKITHYLQRIAECGTSSYPSITPLDFLNIKIKLYPLETQQKIARTLSILDQKIENNHKINELLHKILELLYEQYFVRFDFLDENNKPYQTSGGKMKFSKELNRLIPNDFEVKTLGDNPLCNTIKTGVTPFKQKVYYETKHIQETLSLNQGLKVSYDKRPNRANMQPAIHSVWFAKMKDTKKHLFLNQHMQSWIKESILSTGFCGLQCQNILLNT
ncbi:hypothetical protein HpNP102_02260 [Helicobacter pylori]